MDRGTELWDLRAAGKHAGVVFALYYMKAHIALSERGTEFVGRAQRKTDMR